jgi:hypothetical protein
MRFIRNSAFVGLTVATAVAVLCFPATTQAQSSTMKVAIPFEFHVGDQTLPAGVYAVRNMSSALRISDGKGHIATVISNPVSGGSVGSKDELIFSQYGTRFFLSEARWQGYLTSRGLPKSKGELEVASATPATRLVLAGIRR